MPSIMLVEDHAILTKTLIMFLERGAGYTVTAVAESGEAALEQIAREPVDLVLVDISLPLMSGIQLVAAITERFPALPCLMLSGHDEITYVRDALAVGARGYVKKGHPKTLLKAMSHVLSGEIYLSEELRQQLSA